MTATTLLSSLAAVKSNEVTNPVTLPDATVTLTRAPDVVVAVEVY
jgi:hypothetical protein